MITTETFFWFYSTMAQVAAAIITLIGVLIITYYSIIRAKQLDKIREEKYKIDELRQIISLGVRLSFLFKDLQGLFSSKPMKIKEARDIFYTANGKEEIIKAFKKIFISCLPSEFNPDLSDAELDDYWTRLLTFSNAMLRVDLIKYLKEDNPKLTDEKIAEAQKEARHYFEVINEIKDIRRDIKQNEFKNHFPNQNKIWKWLMFESFIGIIIPLLLLLTIEAFTNGYESHISLLDTLMLITYFMLIFFFLGLIKIFSLIIKDINSKPTDIWEDWF